MNLNLNKIDISTLTKITYVICIVLSAIILGLGYMLNMSIKHERHYIERKIEFHQLGHNLSQASQFLTRETRRYTIYGDQRHYKAYWKEVEETKTRDKVVKRLKELGATPNELALIEKAKVNSDLLVNLEKEAMNAVAQGDFNKARKLMFDKNYDRFVATIQAPIRMFQETMLARTNKEAAIAREKMSRLLKLTDIAVFLFILVVSLALYFIFIRKVSTPLETITSSMGRIASGDVATKIPYRNLDDEIGRLAKSAELFKKSLIANQNLADVLSKHKASLEQEVKVRMEDLRSANNELEEFAYRTSHDLHSPMISAIKLLSIVETAIKNNDQDKAILSLSHAQGSLKKLNNLTRDILILNEVKYKEEEQQNIDFSVLLDEILKKLEHMENYQNLDMRIDLQYPGMLKTKVTRITLIVENLISNAIKYQDPEQEISFMKVSTKMENNNFILEVEDNGLGIPEDKHAELFTMFKRFHPKISFGSGLGLYLIKRSVEIITGEIHFQSLDKGSLFRVSIPQTT